MPFSQFKMENALTPICSPTSFWVRPSSCRFFKMCSPRVWGIPLNPLEISTLRVTGTNGKKATRLCPCGYLGHASDKCRCTPDQITRYQDRISGPLLDRIDMQIQVGSLAQEDLVKQADGELSSCIAERVERAVERQSSRQQKNNNLLSTKEIDEFCKPDAAGEQLLKNAMIRLNWSARAYHRVLKVARTIADLATVEGISKAHIAEAIQYRRALRER